MGNVIVELSMSLDGFVAGPNDSPERPLGDGGERLFQWYSSGDTAFPLPGTDMVFNISRASAELLRGAWAKLGAMVTGRRMFEIAYAWGGKPPGGGPCFFDHLGTAPIELESTGVIAAPGVTHLKFRIIK